MAKYQQLFQKPQVSSWACISRRLKLGLFCAPFIVSVLVLIHIAEQKTSLARIYNIQTSMGDMLDLELRYLPKANEFEGWKETAVKEGHIYSAYLDTRPEQIIQEKYSHNYEITWAMIRIIGILPTELRYAPMDCVYKYKGKDGEQNEKSILTRRRALMVKPVALHESFDMYYDTFFILCDLVIPDKMNYDEFYSNQHLPYEVTIAPIDMEHVNDVKDDSFVPILYPENGIPMAEYSNHFMSVCVPVFHHHFDRPSNLVEFIEFYRMMGVGHFTFYNKSMSSNVGKVLVSYRDEGLVTILPWELPKYFIFEKTLRVDGIFAALNDCLYRSSFHKSYMYVAGIDVDEFIVPKKHKDFVDMMQYLDPLKPNRPLNSQASFIFRNIFFYLMFDDDSTTLPPDMPKLYTQSKTTRWTEAQPGGQRSKYIVRGRQTVELGNHHTWEMRRTSSVFNQQYKEVDVDLNVAASQHYRSCETNVEQCWLRPTVVDKSAHRFTETLGKRVLAECRKIFGKTCPPDKKTSVNNMANVMKLTTPS